MSSSESEKLKERKKTVQAVCGDEELTILESYAKEHGLKHRNKKGKLEPNLSKATCQIIQEYGLQREKELWEKATLSERQNNPSSLENKLESRKHATWHIKKKHLIDCRKDFFTKGRIHKVTEAFCDKCYESEECPCRKATPIQSTKFNGGSGNNQQDSKTQLKILEREVHISQMRVNQTLAEQKTKRNGKTRKGASYSQFTGFGMGDSEGLPLSSYRE